MTTVQRRWLVVIVAAAAVLRFGWALAVRGEPPVDWRVSGDQFSYYYYGRELAAGRGYLSYITNLPTAYYPIGYPAVLAVLYWFVLHTPFPDDLVLATALLHAVLATASVGLVFLLGRAAFALHVGLVGAAIAAFYPNLIYQVSAIQLETTFIFLGLAALAIVATHDWRSGLPSTRRLLAFGFVLGLSMMVRPFSVWFLLGLLAAALVRGAGWRRALLTVCIPAMVMVAMAVPWSVRNAVRLHAFVPSSTNMGDGLCLDRSLDAKGGFRFADHDGCADPDLHEVERNAANTRKAVSFVIHHPGREIVQIGRRAKLMFGSDHDGLDAVDTLGDGGVLTPDTRRVLARVADWYFFVTLALSAVGLVALARPGGRPARVLILIAALSLTIVPLLLWGNPRFHVPLLPLIALAAAVPIVSLWRALPRGTPARR